VRFDGKPQRDYAESYVDKRAAELPWRVLKGGVLMGRASNECVARRLARALGGKASGCVIDNRRK
jgi:hypothetical protein